MHVPWGANGERGGKGLQFHAVSLFSLDMHIEQPQHMQ